MRLFLFMFLIVLASLSARPFLSADGIFMTSINYPQTYGQHTLGLPPFTVPESTPFRSSVPVKKWATVTVLLPTADAKLFVNGRFQSGTGFCRQFISPELSGPGSYLVRATWGNDKDVETTVLVHPGKKAFVSFANDPATAIMKK